MYVIISTEAFKDAFKDFHAIITKLFHITMNTVGNLKNFT